MIQYALTLNTQNDTYFDLWNPRKNVIPYSRIWPWLSVRHMSARSRFFSWITFVIFIHKKCLLSSAQLFIILCGIGQSPTIVCSLVNVKLLNLYNYLEVVLLWLVNELDQTTRLSINHNEIAFNEIPSAINDCIIFDESLVESFVHSCLLYKHCWDA